MITEYPGPASEKWVNRKELTPEIYSLALLGRDICLTELMPADDGQDITINNNK